MKSLLHICLDAEKQIGVNPADAFEAKELLALTTEWVGQLKIISYKIFFRDRMVMVLQNGQGYGPSYTILRFFVVGNKWCVSRDLDSVDNIQLVDYFLDKLK